MLRMLRIDDRPISEMTDEQIELALYRAQVVRSRKNATTAVRILRLVDENYGQLIIARIFEILCDEGLTREGGHQKRDAYNLVYHLQKHDFIPGRGAIRNHWVEFEKQRQTEFAAQRVQDAQTDTFIEEAGGLCKALDAIS